MITVKTKDPMHINPATKLLLMVLVGIIVFVTVKIQTLLLLIILITILMLSSGVYKTTFKFLAIFAIFVLLDIVSVFVGGNLIWVMFLATIFIFWRFMVLFMIGFYIEKTTPVTELIDSLERMKIPRQITIPLAVALRFMPTIREEYSCLRDSMRIRNIGTSFIDLISHPIQTLEYSLVPLLIRSYTISDELAASAMVRGVDNPKQKTSLYQSKLRKLDVILIILGVIFTFALIFFDKYFALG